MDADLEKTVEALKKRRTSVEALIEDVETMLNTPRIEDVFQRPFLARVRAKVDALKNFRLLGSH
jgi:hypothetical protein